VALSADNLRKATQFTDAPDPALLGVHPDDVLRGRRGRGCLGMTRLLGWCWLRIAILDLRRFIEPSATLRPRLS
jgi:hypothetical protein